MRLAVVTPQNLHRFAGQEQHAFLNSHIAQSNFEACGWWWLHLKRSDVPVFQPYCVLHPIGQGKE
jgi:hypothetical protein